MRKIKVIIGLLIIIGLISSVASGLEVSKEAGVAQSSWGQTAIVYYINISNPTQNLTNVYVNETYYDCLTFLNSSIAPDVGNDQWVIPYLNMTGYDNDTWELIIYMTIDNDSQNDNDIGNSALVQSADGEAKGKANLFLHIETIKDSNLSMLKWDTSYVQYYIDVSNTGDIPLQNVLVNETWDANMTFVSANYANVGDTFQLGDLDVGQTKQLVINVTTSYLNTGEKLVNLTRHYNNVTVKVNEISEFDIESYLDTKVTQQIGIVYVEGPTGVEDVGNSVFNIIGVILIIGVLMIVIGLITKYRW